VRSYPLMASGQYKARLPSVDNTAALNLIYYTRFM
jgi:hypothetical protein